MIVSTQHRSFCFCLGVMVLQKTDIFVSFSLPDRFSLFLSLVSFYKNITFFVFLCNLRCILRLFLLFSFAFDQTQSYFTNKKYLQPNINLFEMRVSIIFLVLSIDDYFLFIIILMSDSSV